MKYTILVILFLIFVGCNTETTSKQENIEAPTKTQKRLKKIDLPIEIIQAEVSHLSSPIHANNTTQLNYELNILNNYRIPLSLKKVEIFDLQNNDFPLAVFDSLYIEEHFERPGAKDLDDLKLISGNEYGILHLNLVFDTNKSTPEQIFHKLYFERLNKENKSIVHPMEVAIVNVPKPTELSLRLPFNKKGKWLYGAESHKGSRFITEGKATYPQRFAMDWVFIDNNGVLAKDDIKENKNWNTYGIELIAVADGKVVDIKDGIIENEPLSEDMAVGITKETIGGNYIIIDIGNNIHALYGHLIPNRLKVSIGDKVKKGQVIGLLGNSGNSDAPHLHFHLESKSKAFLGGEGMPYLISEFTQLKKYSEKEFDQLFNENHVSLDSLKPVEKNNELPTGYGLIEVK